MTLASGTAACPQCNNQEIVEVFVVDRSERSEVQRRLLQQQSKWTRLNDSLKRRLDVNGAGWEEPEIWAEWWREIQPLATEIGIKESQASKLAESLWQNQPPKPEEPKETTTSKQDEPDPKPTKPDDVLVNWVRGLPDGRWKVREWNRFLESLGPGADEEALRKQRDEEIDRQFAAFETVSVREDGTPSNPVKQRVRQFIEVLEGETILSLAHVPEGRFMMGSDHYFHEGPARAVNISEFYLGRMLVTQSQWQAVTRLPKVDLDLVNNPAYFPGSDLPVDSVTWPEANEFCARLAAHTKRNYRLPSEAEWEYACRANSTTAFSFGETITPLIVNYDGTQPSPNAPVGEFRGKTVRSGSLGAANKFGLHDMHGNLWEWCADEWHENYAANAPLDGSAWITSAQPAYRTLRGGAWCNRADACRSSERMKGRANETEKLYYIGFRVALSL